MTCRPTALTNNEINLGFYGELFVMSLDLQELRGFTPLRAGVALTPELAMAVVGSAASGRITARSGPRLPMLVGLVVGGAGLASLTLFGAHSSYTPTITNASAIPRAASLALFGAHSSYWELVAPFVATGLGMSLVMPAATTAVMEAAPPECGGLASGTLNAARQVGGLIGVALGAILTILLVERAHRAMSTTPARPSPSSCRDTPGRTGVVPGRRRPPPST